MSESGNKNIWMGFAVFILLVIGTLILFFAPFISSIDRPSEYEYSIWFFGHWRLVEGDQIESGGIDGLPDFPLVTPILILIGIVMAFIFTPWLGFGLMKKQLRNVLLHRLVCILTFFGGVLGFIGTMLFIPFYKLQKVADNNTSYSSGYIVSIVFFALFMIIGLTTVILPYPQRPPVLPAKNEASQETIISEKEKKPEQTV